MGFKGEQVGPFVLDRKVGPCLEGELWKAREAGGGPVAIRLGYESAWVPVLRAAGVPDGVPEHPNLGRPLGAELDVHRPWTAWTYPEGRPLRTVIDERGYVPLAGAVPIVMQLLRGLEALHRAGLAHHDVRPDTVLIGDDGRLCLVFPQTQAMRAAVLERLRDRERPLTPELAAAIKECLPPEQARLRGAIEGIPGDIYQLGMTVYLLLCGKAPDPFAPLLPSQHDRRIPKALDELALGALERRIRGRLESLRGVEQNLLAGLSRAGFVIQPSGPPAGWVKATPFGQPDDGPDAFAALLQALPEQ